MAKELEKETIIELDQVADYVPRNRNGKRKHINTIRKWRDRGVRGVKLECELVGYFWKSSVEAVKRFLEAQRVQPALSAPAARTAAQKRAGNEAAKTELRRRGLVK